MKTKLKVAILAGAALVGVAQPSSTLAQATYDWRVSVVTPSGHPYNIGLDLLKQRIEKGSDGKIAITVFPDSQLGGEVESAKNIQLGTLDMSVLSTSNAAPFHEDLEVLGLPYLFKSLTCAYKVLDGPVGQEMAEELRQKAGLRVLGWYTFGMRQIFNTQRPIKTPADMSGLVFRVPADKIAEASYRALGANPVPMAFPEMFSALQQGVIDGADNPLITLHQFKWYEVVGHASITNTAAGLSPLLISERSFSKLSEDLQKIVIDAGLASAEANREAEAAATVVAREALQKEGVQIEEVDFSAFREGVEPVYQSAREKFGADLLERIDAAQAGC